jgi:hypothetical protein
MTTTVTGAEAPADGERRQRVWSDETTVALVETPDRTRYSNVESLDHRVQLTHERTLERYLDAGAFEVASTVARGDHTFTTLVADATRPGVDGFEDGSFAARFVVDEHGVVHEASVDYATGYDDTETHVEWRVAELGASPDRPAWVDDAPEAAFLNASVDADVERRHGEGTPYLVVTSSGTDPLPDGATLNVTTNGGTGDGRALNTALDLDTDLAPGESVYVYRSDDGLRLTRDESVARSGDGLRSDVGVTVSADAVVYGSFGMG